MALLTHLIDFSAADPRPAEIPVEALPGYAEGYAAAQANAEREASDRLRALTDAVTTLLRSEMKARRDLALSLTPVFDAIGRHLLPETAPKALVAQMCAHFIQIADRTAKAPVVLRCAPEDAATLMDLLPGEFADRVDVQLDLDLPALCLVLGTPDNETIFDRGALTARVAGLFDAFFDHLTESETDG